MKERSAVCPRCGKLFYGYPATSRDGISLICPDCGTREALESIGVGPEEQDRILETVHKYYEKNLENK